MTMIAAKTTAVRPLVELTLIMNPRPYLAFVASTTAQYVQPIPYIIKNVLQIDGRDAGNKTSRIVSYPVIPIVRPVSIRSDGTSSKLSRTDGRRYTKVAMNKKDIFIFSPIPNHRISNGENAVTGI